ncbi:MAG TPA: M3 family metallopeptidase [Caulobacteraceae bacterium]|jgi:peptidyl-dipeptidase Dcp|nr:M3 family metallopeptidase [Caulobacteraceae bacterium]
MTQSPHAAETPDRPIVAAPLDWSAPFETPRLDRIRDQDWRPAFDQTLAAHDAEIAAISALNEPASFANTIAALEDSGRPLGKVGASFSAFSAAMADEAIQALEREIYPRLAAHSDAINLNAALYARVAAVEAGAKAAGLTPEEQRVAERYEINFVRGGARLDEAGKTRMARINQRLASLYTSFGQNVLWDEENHHLVIDDEADLAGLPETLKAAAAAAAVEKQMPGKWLIANTRSAMDPFLTFSSRRELRRQGWKMWVMRGDNGGEHDNKALIREILALRAERAGLLGFPTHAHYQLADNMAKTPEAALELIHAMWAPAVAAAKADAAAFQAMIDAEGGDFRLEPWDWRYYAEKTRKARYDVDESEVKPYLQLSKFREAAFWCASKLYGIDFAERHDIPVYHPDVSTWEVKDAAGETIGLFYLDPFARKGKGSGAWMSELRTEEWFKEPVRPLVINCTNFSKPAEGEAALLSIDDVITIFHEFGHALHGLLTQARYPMVSGANVPRDFVELPSQINEHWAMTPAVLERFAAHYQTGEPMPAALIERIVKARKFNQGFQTVEFLASAWVDMDIHLAGDRQIDVDAFEKESLAKLGMPSEIVMRHRPTQFGHIFSGDGYSAGYYAYLWAQVLDHDGFAAFEETGDVFDPAVAKRFHDEVLIRGNSRDPAESYRAFRGRDPKIDALLRNRGFA